MTDLVKRLREPLDDPFFGKVVEPIKWEAADHIEKLEAALREVLSFGDWGANMLARTIIIEALETKCEQLKEGA
jgi:hypothetical protein